MKITVALFDHVDEALEARRDLEEAGFEATDVHLVVGRKADVEGREDVGVSDHRELFDMLTRNGVPDRDAAVYAEGVRRGRAVVYLTASNHQTEDAAKILGRHNMVDVDARREHWGIEKRPTYSDQSDYEYQPEPPVRQRQQFEAERIERVDGGERRGYRGHYEQHFSHLAGYTYDDYVKAYRFGESIGQDPRFHDHDWSTIAPRARERWEERNSGTWDQFEDAVRYGWEEGRQTLQRQQRAT